MTEFGKSFDEIGVGWLSAGFEFRPNPVSAKTNMVVLVTTNMLTRGIPGKTGLSANGPQRSAHATDKVSPNNRGVDPSMNCTEVLSCVVWFYCRKVLSAKAVWMRN